MRLPRVGVSVGGDTTSPLSPPSLCSSPRPPGAPAVHASRDNVPLHSDNPRRARPAALFSSASPNLHRPQRISAKSTRLRRFQISLKRQPSPPPEAVGVSEGDDTCEARSRIYSKQRGEKPLGSNIPWGLRQMGEVMLLWLMSFVLCRASIWKMGMWLLGIVSEAELSTCGQAVFTLVLDGSMLLATIFIIGKTLKKFQPFKNREIFPIAFKGTWWIAVLIAAACIPVVDWLGTHMTVWFPEDIELPTNNVVVQLSRGDVVPTALYFVLLSVCAPVWEELMFRGFLLQSLGKVCPWPLAVLFSSAIFAMMHGNIRQFLPLCVLGMIIGTAFVRTRNLVPAIVLHSLYNCYVFFHVLFGA